MTIAEYFKYAFKNGYLAQIEWSYTFLTILLGKKTDKKGVNYENKFMSIVSSVGYFKVDEELIPIPEFTAGEVVMKLNDKINLEANILPFVKKDIETTIGKAMANYILLHKPFNGKFEYINERFGIGDIEKKIAKGLSDKTITVDEYKTFVNARSYLEGFSRIVTISATMKNVLPPKGLKEYKKKLKQKMIEKYGEEWNKDRVIIVEYETELKKFYNDYMKDDPTYGKYLSGKVLNNSAPKKFLTFGAEKGFDDAGKNIQHVEDSLLDGYPKDRDKLTQMFNSSRSASFDRGSETQKGGTLGKYVLRATSSVKIVKGDCGTKDGKRILIYPELAKAMVGRYILIGSKVILLKTIEEVNKYVNKVVVLRSPQYCKTKDSDFCSVCVGTALAKYPTGVSIIVTDIAAVVLKSALKSMHNSQVSIVILDMYETLQ